MVKIIFSNGESVEWKEGNLPDSLSIRFDSPSPTPVPDHISADHLEGLCNLIDYLLPVDFYRDLSQDRINRYHEAVAHARERAKWLRQGTNY